MNEELKDRKLSLRAMWEEKHHKEFDYKDKNKLCIECGEKDGRHTYTCIYYDIDSTTNK